MTRTTSLVLRVCRSDGTSHGGFQWPMEVGAEVIAPDWKNNAGRGSGLHGWLYGQGDHTCSDHWMHEGARWMVLEVESSGIVMLGGKCKFERCVVRFVGDMADAADYVAKHEPRAAGAVIIGACKQVGDNASAIVGAMGTATAGYRGTATAGEAGELRIYYWDDKSKRRRTALAYVGENGIKPDTAYRLNDNHQFKESAA